MKRRGEEDQEDEEDKETEGQQPQQRLYLPLLPLLLSLEGAEEDEISVDTRPASSKTHTHTSMDSHTL